MKRIRRALVVPSALSISLVGSIACSPPAAPGACVSNYAVPPDASAPADGIQPQVDIAPCPTNHAGADWFCVTATGCQVEYVGGTMPASGAPIQTVSCPTTDQCLFGLDASGRPVTGVCPQLDVQPQQCTNEFHFDRASLSRFECHAMTSGCTLSDGTQGQRFASLSRDVGGSLQSSSCPTPCTAFA
jgi:hypothetical protein